VIYLTDADCLYSDEALTRLLGPLLPIGEPGGEGEQAATGGSRPLVEQEDRPLPLYVWSADAYSSALGPEHVGGLLGRNAAVRREALDRIGGLSFEARTGTDYQLARRLIEAGYRIRHVRESVVRSEYPGTVGEYRRKQSRWLRNLVQYQGRHRSRQHLMATARTLGVGAAMLAMPAVGGLVARPLLLPWAWLFAHAVASKARYASFAATLAGRPVSPRLLASLPALTLLDFAVWALAAVDLLSARRRARW
jgi:cellulose synthase/poly-beta-1,6-N-acetylglucosamine synthase-like glycosyltransferase